MATLTTLLQCHTFTMDQCSTIYSNNECTKIGFLSLVIPLHSYMFANFHSQFIMVFMAHKLNQKVKVSTTIMFTILIAVVSYIVTEAV